MKIECKLFEIVYYKRRERLFDISVFCIISDFVYNFRHLCSFVLNIIISSNTLLFFESVFFCRSHPFCVPFLFLPGEELLLWDIKLREMLQQDLMEAMAPTSLSPSSSSSLEGSNSALLITGERRFLH